MPQGTIKATVLIETILAAFEMDEILYELREHSAGLNAGRWDYIFSVIKKLGHRPEFVLPDRADVTMAVPFMRSYCELLVKTCHRRGAHAMGGMAAFIPSRRDPEVNAVALARVREDKEREASQGFDGTWVAHPDLVPVAQEAFDAVLGDRPNQIDRQRDDVELVAADLLDVAATPGEITDAGLRNNVSVGIQYLAAWLRRLRRRRDQQPDGGCRDRRDQPLARSGSGCTTAASTADDVRRVTDEEIAKLGPGYDDARAIFERIATAARLRRVPHAARLRPARRDRARRSPASSSEVRAADWDVRCRQVVRRRPPAGAAGTRPSTWTSPAGPRREPTANGLARRSRRRSARRERRGCCSSAGAPRTRGASTSASSTSSS